ncbi:Oxysterol-binding protein-like protein [Venustampulla echinocandica]|uniref:Oxysterol-binding protein-like protein n=1 Tax=Venustampulla echinocandica TaxID=2656787 RepID=A0A370TCF4_9HELO|nr:Oxysterol-binding protein-like protein [Venustampulla echinocandica]RDL31914.1 Oxysterol-binding protein-like protein [Venustampulla echinocandica]
MASASSGSIENSPPTTGTSSMESDASSINPTPVASEKPPDDTSKLRMFLGILRKFIGVTDIASVRFSLPAQLLEPTPNLEYWNYLDQPNTFVAIGDSDEPLDRMLEVLRFWFTKDLKYVKGKPCKPYNSALGEFFRCNWVVEDHAPPIPSLKALSESSESSTKSIKSRPTTPSVAATKVGKITPVVPSEPVTVSSLTEQTSHHPPVSAFYVDCPAKGISARGFDQLSAKFTGTSIKVTPGEHNLGIFVTLEKRDNEEYQLTHPAAHLAGLLRGSLSVTVGDQCYVTCTKTKIKTILNYLEEGWLGKTQNKMEGVVFRYDPDNDNITKIRDVPEKDILARVQGNWKEKVYFSLAPKFDTQLLLIDLTPLSVAPKILPPFEAQLPNESVRFWSGVTEAIKTRQFSRATTLKQELEERQREKAKAREESGTKWQPRFFTGVVTPLGKPELTDEGRKVLDGLHQGKFELKESDVLGA